MRPRRLSARRLAWLPGLALSTTLAAAEPGLGRLHAFKDWLVGCDNTRVCEAQGYAPDNDEGAPGRRAALIVRREAGPGQAPQLLLRFSRFDETDRVPPPGVPVRLVAGSLRLTLPPIDPATEELAVPAAQVPALLAALLRAERLQLFAGRAPWWVSLAGAQAALLKMDDLQGRVDTPGALVRRGPRVEPAAPPVPRVRAAALPPTTDADRRLEPRLRAALPRSADDCPSFDATEPLTGFARLTASSFLVAQPCFRGAYQTGHRLWQVDDRPPFRARALKPPGPSRSTEDDEGLVVIESLETTGGTLSLGEAAKGRGIGDCWVSREWTWTAQGLALLDATESACRAFEAGGLPVRLWRAQLD